VEHDEAGLVTENPQLRERMMEKRAARLALVLTELPVEALLRHYGPADAPLLIISWGSNLGAVQDALARLQAKGHPARAIQIRILWPFPVAAVEAALAGASTTVVVEGNESGQLATLLQAQTGHQPSHRILKYSGRPICGDALAEALEAILLGQGEARMVLRNPYE
jgi:2-oxoglutarate ferredoxin oxidoreductase subunit alpha